MCSKAPRGIPHPQSEYAKRINRFAAASPISAIAQKNLVALTWKSGLDLVHDPLPDLNLVTIGPNGVRIYDGITGRDQYVVKGTTVLQGTVSDLLGQLQFQAASSHECRRSFYKLFLRTFSHSINFPQEGASVDANGFQVHWLALRGDGVHSTPFDMVIASYTQQYVWDHSEWRTWTPHDGSQGAQDAGTHVWESIDTRMMPPFHDATTTTGCSRLHIHRSGFVVEKCVDLANYCEVSFILRFNEHGLSRPWLYELVGGFPRYFRRDLYLVIPTQLWSYNEYCHMCFKVFRLYRRRHHCRLCGHATCSNCSHNVEIDVASNVEASIVGRVPILVCHKCSVHYRASRQDHRAITSSVHSQMSTSASSTSRPTGPRQMNRSKVPPSTWTVSRTITDENESLFTIHAPTPSPLPRRSPFVPSVALRDQLNSDALYTIHVPVPSITGLRQKETLPIPIYSRPSDVDLFSRPSISLSSSSKSSIVRRRPSATQREREVDATSAPPAAATSSKGINDRSSVLHMQSNSR